MYELEYVKKRKRRKFAVIAGGVSAVVVTSLSIVAFLGRFVGTFTVSLDTGNVKLALSQKSSFTESTSYLRVDELAPFNEYTYSSLIDVIGEDNLDNEESGLSIGAVMTDTGSIKSLKFFKYTFYVKNVGDIPARYTFQMNILESKPDPKGRTLDKTLRVAIYDNDASENTHNKVVYAKALDTPAKDSEGNPHKDDQGNLDYSAPISVSEYDSKPTYPFCGYATSFKTGSIIASYTVDRLNEKQMRRYTIVSWLEGYASDAGESAPKGASIKLGVEINAYEI